MGEEGVKNDREKESTQNGSTPSPGDVGFFNVGFVVVVVIPTEEAVVAVVIVIVVMVVAMESLVKAVGNEVEGLGKEQEKGSGQKTTGRKHRNNNVGPKASDGRIGVPAGAEQVAEPVSSGDKRSGEGGKVDEHRCKDDGSPWFF